MDSRTALNALVKAATSGKPQGGPALRFAKATAEGLRLEGPDPVLLPGRITALCDYVAGDRVALIFDGARAVVIGVDGGATMSGTLDVGTIAASEWASLSSGVFYLAVSTAALPAPPSGYRYSFGAPDAAGGSGCWILRTQRADAANPTVLLATYAANQKTGVAIPWHLVRA